MKVLLGIGIVIFIIVLLLMLIADVALLSLNMANDIREWEEWKRR